MTRRLVLGVMLVLLVAAPAWAQGLVSFDVATIEIVSAKGKRHSLTVEMAVSDRQLAQGLMFRTSMAPDAGMLFDFAAPRQISMWMKNTLMPLDMVFLDNRGVVTGVAADAAPMSTAIITSPGPVRAVLELNAGTARRLGLRVGDRVVHDMFKP